MRGRAAALILVARAISLAVALACAAAILHAITLGREALALAPAAAVLCGITLITTAALRERGTMRQSGALVALTMAAAAAWGMTLAARAPDALAALTRVIGFAILGEAYLWRALGIARGQQRWREVRGDALVALGAVALASLFAGPIDRDALPALGLLVAFAGAVGLSLARSAEELALSTAEVRAATSTGHATGTAFALGVLALAVGFALPLLEAMLLSLARAVGPLLGDLIFAILLPLGYVAAYLVQIALWLREVLRPTGLELRIPQAPFDPADDAQRLREMEQARPFVFGAVEVVIGIVALAFALALVARLVQERRAVLPDGAEVERSPVEGIGLRATLRGLLPRRARRPRPPADDGTLATALRRVYWSLLDLADREGPGRRGAAETPAEHEQRLLRSSDRWRPASEIVRAFEDLRYGEAAPDAATVERARAALRRAEAAR